MYANHIKAQIFDLNSQQKAILTDNESILFVGLDNMDHSAILDTVWDRLIKVTLPLLPLEEQNILKQYSPELQLDCIIQLYNHLSPLKTSLYSMRSFAQVYPFKQDKTIVSEFSNETPDPDYVYRYYHKIWLNAFSQIQSSHIPSKLYQYLVYENVDYSTHINKSKRKRGQGSTKTEYTVYSANPHLFNAIINLWNKLPCSSRYLYGVPYQKIIGSYRHLYRFIEKNGEPFLRFISDYQLEQFFHFIPIRKISKSFDSIFRSNWKSMVKQNKIVYLLGMARAITILPPLMRYAMLGFEEPFAFDNNCIYMPGFGAFVIPFLKKLYFCSICFVTSQSMLIPFNQKTMSVNEALLRQFNEKYGTKSPDMLSNLYNALITCKEYIQEKADLDCLKEPMKKIEQINNRHAEAIQVQLTAAIYSNSISGFEVKDYASPYQDLLKVRNELFFELDPNSFPYNQYYMQYLMHKDRLEHKSII